MSKVIKLVMIILVMMVVMIARAQEMRVRSLVLVKVISEWLGRGLGLSVTRISLIALYILKY